MAEQDYVRLAAACHCGQPVKLWSGQGQKPKYCSKPCKRRAKNQPRESKKTYTCAHCAKSFEGQAWLARMYCSNRCKLAGWRMANPERAAALEEAKAPKSCAVYAGYCEECGQSFVSRRKRSCCSERCFRRQDYRARYVSTAPAIRTCAHCESVFPAPPAVTKPTSFCSEGCKTQAKARIRRVSKGMRKARQRAVAVERVDPIKVFERDGWACRLCGVPTPPAKRGTYEPDAPELDHIIPLAKGGEHSYRNTQCACRRCNGLKGVRSMDEVAADLARTDAPRLGGAIEVLPTA